MAGERVAPLLLVAALLTSCSVTSAHAPAAGSPAIAELERVVDLALAALPQDAVRERPPDDNGSVLCDLRTESAQTVSVRLRTRVSDPDQLLRRVEEAWRAAGLDVRRSTIRGDPGTFGERGDLHWSVKIRDHVPDVVVGGSGPCR
jgi:hypothetical protein